MKPLKLVLFIGAVVLIGAAIWVGYQYIEYKTLTRECIETLQARNTQISIYVSEESVGARVEGLAERFRDVEGVVEVKGPEQIWRDFQDQRKEDFLLQETITNFEANPLADQISIVHEPSVDYELLLQSLYDIAAEEGIILESVIAEAESNNEVAEKWSSIPFFYFLAGPSFTGPLYSKDVLQECVALELN